MNRSLVVRNVASVFFGASLIIVACSDQTTEDTPQSVTEVQSAAHNFCGNGRCDHGETCSSCSQDCGSTDANSVRQVRGAGGTARSYVEGATTGCSASGNAAKHIPALYYFGTYTDGMGTHSDHDFCNTEVRPYSEFDPNNLATYTFI